MVRQDEPKQIHHTTLRMCYQRMQVCSHGSWQDAGGSQFR